MRCNPKNDQVPAGDSSCHPTAGCIASSRIGKCVDPERDGGRGESHLELAVWPMLVIERLRERREDWAAVSECILAVVDPNSNALAYRGTSPAQYKGEVCREEYKVADMQKLPRGGWMAKKLNWYCWSSPVRLLRILIQLVYDPGVVDRVKEKGKDHRER